MVSISADDFANALAAALDAAPPGAAANAERIVNNATEQLDPDDTSFRAAALRGATKRSVDRKRGN
ncbi:hypothetical protein [Amycolatopsis sp. cmx-4-61]|jgi:hypothetical protein|uniref:hypothetical protein n=1 Tax=Amycolatopsis sp. cmx-4-61 TaxID=2790937 RepID=UPI00397B5241